MSNNKELVVIMAGGFGKRAREISDVLPKPLLPIAGKPILLWEIECLVRQGYTNIILTVSYMAEKIQEYFGDGSKFNCNISYYVEKQPLGNAGALFKLWQEHSLSDDFILLNADSMFDINFDKLVSFHKSKKALATLFVHPNSHPYDSALIIPGKEGMVKAWITKEDDRPDYYKNYVNAGIHVLNTDIFGEVDIDPVVVGTKFDNKVFVVDLDRQVLKPLCNEGRRVYVYKSPEYVKDMGTPERFEAVSRDLATGLVSARNLLQPQKAIFLDRDGTINQYVGFLHSPDQFELIDGVAEAVRLINNSGYLAIVITNQPVIARGEMTTEGLELIHCKMETLLGVKGAYLDGIYYCPHHPDKGFAGEVVELKVECDCRKPKPGMILQAAKEYNIDLEHSWMIGDSWSDVQVGENAGCRTALLVRDIDLERDSTQVMPDIYADSLLDAVKEILKTI